MTVPESRLDLFKGRHFDGEVILLCVRWYLSFKLSSRDLVQMMNERGITLAHTTVLRWVQRYVPEFEKRWSQYARPVGGSWRCDETYIKVKGQWRYCIEQLISRVIRWISCSAKDATWPRRNAFSARHWRTTLHPASLRLMLMPLRIERSKN